VALLKFLQILIFFYEINYLRLDVKDFELKEIQHPACH